MGRPGAEAARERLAEFGADRVYVADGADYTEAGVSAWDALRAGFTAIMTANHTPERVLRLSTLIFKLHHCTPAT